MERQNTAGITTQSFIQLALIQARVLHLSNLNTVVSTYSSLNIWKGGGQSPSIENKCSIILQSHGTSAPCSDFQATHAQPHHSVDTGANILLSVIYKDH